MIRDSSQVELAVAHLCKSDPVMRRLIKQVGPFGLKLRRGRFQMLVRSIISQQISTAAARSIRERLEKLAAPEGLTPARIRRLTMAQLRRAGLSPQKSVYLHELAEAVDGKRLRLDRVARMSDEEIIEQLVEVKGIGRWTAQMFLIFSLGRWDVFPHDDLGVRMAIRDLYGLADLPNREASHAIAQRWRPFATVASWYCWRSRDLVQRKLLSGAAK